MNVVGSFRPGSDKGVKGVGALLGSPEHSSWGSKELGNRSVYRLLLSRLAHACLCFPDCHFRTIYILPNVTRHPLGSGISTFPIRMVASASKSLSLHASV